MLSGERRITADIGTTTAIRTRPDMTAPCLQPKFSTITATSGVITAPPTDIPVVVMDMARPLRRTNHWLIEAMMPWLNPAFMPRASTPTYTIRNVVKL